MRGRLKELLDNKPDQTKKLLTVAFKIAKEKDQPFNRNATFLLAMAAENAKEIEISAHFYRLNAAQSLKLLSERGIANAYLGLIRQAQRGFSMDFEVSLAFENINASGDAEAGYGVDHVAVAEAMGCKAVRVRRPEEFATGFAEASRLMKEHQVPVVLEFILERVTNVSMGTDIDNIVEFEELAERNEDAPTAIALLD